MQSASSCRGGDLTSCLSPKTATLSKKCYNREFWEVRDPNFGSRPLPGLEREFNADRPAEFLHRGKKQGGEDIIHVH